MTEQEFNTTVQNITPSFLRFVRSKVADTIICEDIFQEALISLWQANSKLKIANTNHFRALLSTILKWKIGNYYRAKTRQKYIHLHLETDISSRYKKDDDEVSNISTLNYYSFVFHGRSERHTDQRLERLHDAVMALPPKIRDAMISVYYYGYKHRELAEKYGTALGTISRRVHRGKLKLKELLK
jgi:RNA polymerase sigma factor (sigma-70 family)